MRILLSAVLVCGLPACSAVSSQTLAAEQLFAPMPATAVRQQVTEWTTQHAEATDASRAAIDRLWSEELVGAGPGTLHEVSVQSFALVDPRIAGQLQQCRFGSLAVKQADVLSDESLPTFVSSNLRAYVARFLTQAEFFDEALALSAAVEPTQLIDPAGYYFHRAVCEHRLLKKDAGLISIKTLLHDTADVPVRYSSIAELMETDLQKLKEKSLDEIQRLMSDVERRLDHARGGEKTQEVEKTIIERLDELIDKIEKQQQQAQQNAQQVQQNGQQSKVAPDSMIKGSTAPGEVDQRDIGNKAGWGALPPKQQTKAKNLIDRELPPHYRNAIEQYLRKLAKRPAAQQK
ncbi:MAG: hypothetical protein ACYTGL_04330 [Planctomycetota bacterium]|jgi:flagellar hook-basal body complex protein FliE